MSINVAVIVVSWNVRDLLRQCLSSLLADLSQTRVDNHPATAQILVVDCASSDSTTDMIRSEFPAITVIPCAENIGYVKGNNLGLAKFGFTDVPSVYQTATDRIQVPGDGYNQATLQEKPPDIDLQPRYVWLLNPDTNVLSGAMQHLLDFMQQHPRCGLCGPKLLNADRSLQHSAFEFPGLVQLILERQPVLWRFRGTPLDGRYSQRLYKLGLPFRVGHPLGAAMLARAEAIRRIGVLDTAYEMYAEEIDWAMRMDKAGWERWCVPAAVVIHYGGSSSTQASERTERIKWQSRQHYYTRYYSLPKRWLAKQLVPGLYRI